MMSSPRRMSAIEELDITVYGGPTTDEERSATVTVAGIELLKPNPDRVQYWITNNGPSTIYWSARANPTATQGHQLGAGQVLIVRARDDGSFCGRRLYAAANAADSEVTITEVERAHRR
jgi:hypothetical protein